MRRCKWIKVNTKSNENWQENIVKVFKKESPCTYDNVVVPYKKLSYTRKLFLESRYD